MKLPQVKEELDKRGITYTHKHKKADLLRMLKEAVNPSIFVIISYNDDKSHLTPKKINPTLLQRSLKM